MQDIIKSLSGMMPLMIIFVSVGAIYIAYFILKKFGVLEGTVNVDDTTEKIKKDKDNLKMRDFEKMKLEIYSSFCEYFKGIVLPEAKRIDFKYYIARLNIRSEALGRLYTPEELMGKFMFVAVLGVLCIPVGFYFKPAFFVSIGLLVYCVSREPMMKQHIRDDDEIIDLYFIDLYLLLYSKLRQGSKARLGVTVESYIDTLTTATDYEMKRVMLGLSQFLLNNLSMYPDHEAVPKLRERYRNATIVNFCNVASQALQGIDNADTLLTFKMNLVERKTKAMRLKAQKLRVKAEMSIYAIYVILFVFIIISWASKITF